MLKPRTIGLLLVASAGVAQAQPSVRPVLTRAEAQSLSRDPSAVLADPAAVTAIAAFVAPLQQHAPRDSGGGAIGALFDALPASLMVPVEVSGTLLWVSVATDIPEDAYPHEMGAGSELAIGRYVVHGDAEPLTSAEAVCPADGRGYRVWDVAGVGPVEGCVTPGE